MTARPRRRSSKSSVNDLAIAELRGPGARLPEGRYAGVVAARERCERAVAWNDCAEGPCATDWTGDNYDRRKIHSRLAGRSRWLCEKCRCDRCLGARRQEETIDLLRESALSRLRTAGAAAPIFPCGAFWNPRRGTGTWRRHRGLSVALTGGAHQRLAPT